MSQVENIEFKWDEIGDISLGRENLGEEMPVAVYRLFEYCMKKVLISELGAENADNIFRRCGFLAGQAFAKQWLKLDEPFPKFISQLQSILKEFKIGIFRLEKADLESMEFTISVAEDLDCSGLPVMGEAVCNYDEGFIAGILGTYTKMNFTAREVDCWATGGRTCRFEAKGEI